MVPSAYNLTKFRNKIIAIDGPAGSGKSTTAFILAARLGHNYLDTGAMYRALTWLAMEAGVSPSDAPKLSGMAKNMTISFKTEEDLNRVFINEHEITHEIRTPEVTKLVSEVSAHPEVRKVMVEKQKLMGAKGGVVAEGRDTTTVVFPHAHVKVYLDASVTTRADRRLIDLAKMGVSMSREELIKDIERRDKFDSERKHSPLTNAHDAYTIDTTNCTIEDQVDQILSILKNVLK